MYYHYGKCMRGCPLLRGNKCTITMGSGILCLEVVLFSEGPLSEVQLRAIACAGYFIFHNYTI